MASSEAFAAVSTLARKFGTVVADASGVEVAVGESMVSQSHTGPDASRRSRTSGTNILDLPDASVTIAIVERLFEILDSNNGREFPCDDSLRIFVLSCPRFSNLYCKSFVKKIGFFVNLHAAEAALRYHEAVFGALSRFTSIEKV